MLAYSQRTTNTKPLSNRLTFKLGNGIFPKKWHIMSPLNNIFIMLFIYDDLDRVDPTSGPMTAGGEQLYLGTRTAKPGCNFCFPYSSGEYSTARDIRQSLLVFGKYGLVTEHGESMASSSLRS